MPSEPSPGTACGPSVPAATSPVPWPAPTAASPVDAVVTLPGSKSLTNRYLVLAALAADTSRLRHPLRSRDTLLMAQALRSLGARISDVGDGPAETGEDWLVEPAPLRGGTRVDCGLAGTVMRFLPPVAALAGGSVTFDGDPQARRRPMATGLTALRALGIAVEDSGGTMPFTVHGSGHVAGGQVRMDASASSQFISGLMLAGARFSSGVTVVHEGPPVPSEPHLLMTAEVLRDAGVDVDDSSPNRWRVEPSEIYALDVHVEPDLSNAATFLAAAMVTGGRVHIPDWPQHTTQAGDAIRDIFDAMGGSVSLSREGLTVAGPDTIHGLDVDLHDAGELTPVVTAVAALADTPSWLRGISHLRGHETDRLSALATELNALGGHIEDHGDALHVLPATLHGGLFHTYADHRMAMAGTIVGLTQPGVAIEDIAATGKTMPDFASRWLDMLNESGSDYDVASSSATTHS